MRKLLEDKDLLVFINEIGTFLKVSLKKEKKSSIYACYFYSKEGITKYHYQKSVDFLHVIKFRNFEYFKIKYFIWNKDEDIRTSQTIDISNYLNAFSSLSSFVSDSINQTLLSKDVSRYISNTNFVKIGEVFFNDNKIELASFPSIEWQGWEADPFNNRSWQWALHWFDFSKHLLAYYHKTGNDDVLMKLKSLIASWLDIYLYKDNPSNEFIWHDHATALRAKQILMLLCYLKEYNKSWMYANLSFTLSLFNALTVFGAKLVQEEFYSKHTNHGLEQVRVLMLLGLVLNYEEWVDIASSRLSDELDYSFTSEGVHKENSPGYHQFVFKIFLSIVEQFPDYVLKGLSIKFKELAPKALNYITYILRPDNKLPIIGDTELKSVSDSYKNYFSGTEEYENFMYSLHQGERGQPPLKKNIVYPKSGYAIFRNFWGKSNNFTDSVHLVFKAGCLSRYHHQQDENSFVLYAFGEDWIIDSGLYNYINNDPIRRYVRRRHAHNIPIFSNTSYNHEDFNHRIDNWNIYDYSEDDNNPYVAAKNRVLVTVEHDRKISFNMKEHRLVIEDKVCSIDRQERDITFLLHVPIDKLISIQGDSVLIKSLESGLSLMLTFSIKPDSISTAIGVQEGKVSSIVSESSNSYIDSQVIKIRYRKREKLNITTQMVFSM